MRNGLGGKRKARQIGERAINPDCITGAQKRRRRLYVTCRETGAQMADQVLQHTRRY